MEYLTSVYAEPKKGVSLQEATFYHRLDLPELQERKWMWDLRGDESRHLGNVDFAGKRVLEFGTANGALRFWMERQGAEVVAVDLSPDVSKTSWDTLLLPDDDPTEVNKRMASGVQRLNNGFWYAHERLESKARLVHGTAYQVPKEIGKFDVVTLCAILLHLRDPIGALANALQFTRNTIIIADMIPSGFTAEELKRPRPLHARSGVASPARRMDVVACLARDLPPVPCSRGLQEYIVHDRRL